MYEANVQIGSVQDIFEGKTLKEVCEEDTLKNGWKGVYWECSIIEIDVPRSFLSGRELCGDDGRCYELPELWKVGKKSFDGLRKVYEKEIESNLEFELLSYIFFSNIFHVLKAFVEEGLAYSDSKEVAVNDIDDISFFESFPSIIKHLWSEMGDAEKGVLEAFLHCRVVRLVDSSVIQYLMNDSRAMSEAAEELYSYTSCLDWIESYSKSLKSQAGKAAKARHAETEWIKQQVYEYYDEHKHEFKSLRAAAIAIEKREPVKFRTIYDWLRNRE